MLKHKLNVDIMLIPGKLPEINVIKSLEMNILANSVTDSRNNKTQMRTAS